LNRRTVDACASAARGCEAAWSRDETDHRTVSGDNSLVTVAYREIRRARIQSYQASFALDTCKPTAKGEIGEMWFVKGDTELKREHALRGPACFS
jgi:hypothetical protein